MSITTLKPVMAQFTLQGSIVAIATPFKNNGDIDTQSFDKLIEFQIENGTNGIVVCGTTGETPTLTEAEDTYMFEYALKRVNGRVPVIAGSGSNSTDECIKYSKTAESTGVDALLVVGPYYNKPTAKGMYNHFGTLAQKVKCPIILYNVPGRTGSAIPVDVTMKLANEFDNIVGVKEASGNIHNVASLLAQRPAGFRVYSGDDSLSVMTNLLGGDGCISVAANVIPKDFSQMMAACIKGDVTTSRQLFFKYRNLMDLLFIESNPIPVKTALAAMGLIEENFRLPMCSMEDGNKQKLINELKRLNII